MNYYIVQRKGRKSIFLCTRNEDGTFTDIINNKQLDGDLESYSSLKEIGNKYVSVVDRTKLDNLIKQLDDLVDSAQFKAGDKVWCFLHDGPEHAVQLKELTIDSVGVELDEVYDTYHKGDSCCITRIIEAINNNVEVAVRRTVYSGNIPRGFTIRAADAFKTKEEALASLFAY